GSRARSPTQNARSLSISEHKKTTHPNHLISRFLTDFLNNKTSFAGGWSHCVTPTTITSVFSRTVVNHKIGTHAGGAGPHDFLFDESENGER
ncbi:hypothetical protein ACWBT9_005522, partial [Escherichia coli]